MKTQFEVNLNSPTFHQDVIRQAIEQLMSMRNTTSKRELLEWEIRVYRWILRQPDPEGTAMKYFAKRQEMGGIMSDKAEVIKALGWEIA